MSMPTVPVAGGLILFFWLTSTAAQTLLPIRLIPSSKHHGPDGPWQAINVSLGDPPQQLDLYPGGTFETIIFSTDVCNGTAFGPCGTGGLFNPASSFTIDDTSIEYSDRNHGSAVDWTLGTMQYSGEARYVTDTLRLGRMGTQGEAVIPALSIRIMSKISMSYPDGSRYPLQVGQLALGSSNINQSFDAGSGIPSVNASLVPNYLWETKVIPSSSYGLHIGSASLNLPMSLWFGGYDPTRVFGQISSLPSHNSDLDNFLIDLLDISIGVDHGGSPFPYKYRQGILAAGNSSVSQAIPVAMDPAAPYLYLPKSTCMAITEDLPVTYNVKYGLYFWNLHDPRYQQIVTSPSYLGFTFRTPSLSTRNLTIKVPFALLNLTLQAPLVENPTPYFPCQTPQMSSTYGLGRAFLQAAFIGVDWDLGLGKWYLAQAPGPNTAETPAQTVFSKSLISSSNDWAGTWDGFWTALPEKHSVATGTVRSSPTSDALSAATSSAVPHVRLSPGAYAGIGVGCGLAALATFWLLLFMLRRRKGVKDVSIKHQDEIQDFKEPEVRFEAPGPEPGEISSNREPAWELSGRNRQPAWELSGRNRETAWEIGNGTPKLAQSGA